MEIERTKKIDWREEASNNLEYYIDTEEGRNKLVEMIRAEAVRLLQQMKGRERVRDAIWLSKFCFHCSHLVKGKRGSMRCMRWDSRIVKPFYGKPLWTVTLTSGGEELKIVDLDWDSKSFSVSNILVEEAIKRVNNGYPYSCFNYGR